MPEYDDVVALSELWEAAKSLGFSVEDVDIEYRKTPSGLFDGLSSVLTGEAPVEPVFTLEVTPDDWPAEDDGDEFQTSVGDWAAVSDPPNDQFSTTGFDVDFDFDAQPTSEDATGDDQEVDDDD
jgi:outer membrane protein OmpA-like peptidoglycan-associated protein